MTKVGEKTPLRSTGDETVKLPDNYLRDLTSSAVVKQEPAAAKAATFGPELKSKLLKLVEKTIPDRKTREMFAAASRIIPDDKELRKWLSHRKTTHYAPEITVASLKYTQEAKARAEWIKKPKEAKPQMNIHEYAVYESPFKSRNPQVELRKHLKDRQQAERTTFIAKQREEKVTLLTKKYGVTESQLKYFEKLESKDPKVRNAALERLRDYVNSDDATQRQKGEMVMTNYVLLKREGFFL